MLMFLVTLYEGTERRHVTINTHGVRKPCPKSDCSLTDDAETLTIITVHYNTGKY